MSNNFFICYAREDIEFVNLLNLQLLKQKSETKNEIHLVMDTSTGAIRLGDRYQAKIENLIENSRGAIIFISENSKNSEFIKNVEIPKILKTKQKNEDFIILPIFIDSNVEFDKEILSFQTSIDEESPLRNLNENLKKIIFNNFIKQIDSVLSLKRNSSKQKKFRSNKRFLVKNKNSTRNTKLSFLIIFIISLIYTVGQIYNESENNENLVVNPETKVTMLESSVPNTSLLINKSIASELEVGDCFSFINEEYTNSWDQKISLVDCYEIHEWEVFSTVKYSTTETSILNDEGIPNDEIFNLCKESFEEIYSRPIAGSLSWGQWLGGNNFNDESNYFCIIGVFNSTIIDNTASISIPYADYITNFKSNSKEVPFSFLTEGRCFNVRGIVDNLETIVDLVPCNLPHRNEVIKIYSIPENLITVDEIEDWAFDVCHMYNSFVKNIDLFMEDKEYLTGKDFRVDYVFDSKKWEFGEINEIYCFSSLTSFSDRTTYWEKEFSLFSEANARLIGIKASETEPVSLKIYCPYTEDIEDLNYLASFYIFLIDKDAPINKLVFKVKDSTGSHYSDFSKQLINSGISVEELLPLDIDLFFLYFYSNDAVTNISLLENGELEIYSITVEITDSNNNFLSAVCEVTASEN